MPWLCSTQHHRQTEDNVIASSSNIGFLRIEIERSCSKGLQLSTHRVVHRKIPYFNYIKVNSYYSDNRAEARNPQTHIKLDIAIIITQSSEVQRLRC